MQNLPKNLTELRECLSRIKPWAAIAGLCAAVLLGFYAFEGVQYWEAWKQSKDMTVEVDRITRKLSRGVPNTEESARNLAAQQQRRDYLRAMFDYPDAARLIGIVSTNSWDTGIDLPSISAGDPVLDEVDGMRYLNQPIALTARGEVSDIYRFLEKLNEDVKVVSVPNISIASPGEADATAQVQLIFHLSPKSTDEEEGAD